jgi:hypothetical protein
MRCKPSRSRTRWLRDVIGGGAITGKTTFRALQNSFAKIVKLCTAQSRSTGDEDRQPRIKNLSQRAIQQALEESPFISDNPFKFPNWLNHDGDGGTKTTDEVLLGQNNRIHSPDDSNPLSDTLTGATIIDVRTPGNAALVGNNGTVIEAGIGVYGHSVTVTAAEEGFNASEPVWVW